MCVCVYFFFFLYLNASMRFNLNLTIVKSAHSCVPPPPQRPLKQLDFCIFLSGIFPQTQAAGYTAHAEGHTSEVSQQMENLCLRLLALAAVPS